jgi:hypothetical protein
MKMRTDYELEGIRKKTEAFCVKVLSHNSQGWRSKTIKLPGQLVSGLVFKMENSLILARALFQPARFYSSAPLFVSPS